MNKDLKIIGEALDCLGKALHQSDVEGKDAWIGFAIQELSKTLTKD